MSGWVHGSWYLSRHFAPGLVTAHVTTSHTAHAEMKLMPPHIILGRGEEGNETSPLNLFYLLSYFLPVPFRCFPFVLDQKLCIAYGGCRMIKSIIHWGKLRPLWEHNKHAQSAINRVTYSCARHTRAYGLHSAVKCCFHRRSCELVATDAKRMLN